MVLGKYNKALKQRNGLLKNELVSRDSVFSWDVMLAKYGVALSVARDGLVKKINNRLTDAYRDIAKNKDVAVMQLVTAEVDESKYLAELQGSFEKDRSVTHTTFGAHLDDYIFIFNEKPADGSASRGEVRSMILALKFVESQLVREELGKSPLILLDDIFSELDEARQKQLVTNFRQDQVIITGVRAPKELGRGVNL